MIIRRETLQAVLPATTDTDRRYFLTAINIRPDGTVESTNGHVAIQAKEHTPFPDEDFPTASTGLPAFHGSPEGNTLIPSALVRTMIAAMEKKPTVPILASMQLAKNGAEGAATVAVTDLQAPRTAKIPPPDATFPQLDRVMPPADKAGSVKFALSVEVLETLCKAAKAAMPGKRTPVLTFEIPADGLSAARVTVSGPDVALVMAAMPCLV